jgi:hypothetical protein
MRSFGTLAALTLLIGACDRPTAAPAQQPTGAQSAEQQQMHRLNELNRAIALKRAILSSGYRCQRIDRSGYVQEYGNLSMWTANCSDKRSWAVFIGPDASVQVRPCEDMAEFNLPACVIRPTGKPAA